MFICFDAESSFYIKLNFKNAFACYKEGSWHFIKANEIQGVYKKHDLETYHKTLIVRSNCGFILQLKFGYFINGSISNVRI